MESNYLISASEGLFLERGVSLNNRQAEDLEDLLLLRLNKLLLKDVNLIQSCVSLTVCTLSNNYLTDISALRSCSRLVKLDLHGNQIQTLPDHQFWRELKELNLLYLHDNQFRSAKDVESLSFCPKLTGLTLFDTPFSLQKRYRHVVVNSIWSLKALDDHVISDEEIIEDWSVPERFQALNPNLRVNMSPASGADIGYQNEMKLITSIISNINHVHSHYSPVLIIQRWIRGFLARKRLGLVSPLKMQKEKIHVANGPGEDINGRHVVRISIRDLPAFPYSAGSKNLPAVNQTTKCANNSPADAVKHITVDLRKLQRHVLQVLPDPETDCNRNQKQSPVQSTETLKKEKKTKEVKSKLFLQKDQMEPSPEEKDEPDITLLGLSARVYESDSRKDLGASHEESARAIRQSIQHFHAITQTKSQTTHSRNGAKKEDTVGQVMSLKHLYDVDKAYEIRKQRDLQERKKDSVLRVQSQKTQAKCNIQGFLEEKKKNALEENEKHCVSLQEITRRNRLAQQNFIDKVKQRQERLSQEKQRRASECSFVREFNAQHTSVAKTLLKHERMTRKSAETQEKIRCLRSLKENEEKQKEFAKCLKEHRQLVLQIENASEKASLASDARRKAQDRLRDARTRVTGAKGQRVAAEPMFKVPVNQLFPRQLV
ncbi:leucine-rich repeat and IQ domain-containing protein 3 [Spea bombifrons]|uniref:leucine-rich repeat and IQ domain-containing protein 3 n=1 Tax=Spea bombifrons TaxID=233779 RepID=UPI00234B6318|nr:leucine-rich repeat and IQ domain-containing protein 3 [Spea bombifrons]